MKRQRYFILTITILVAVLCVYAQTSDNNRQKSRYYYFQGIIHSINGDNASAHELFRYSVETDPENLEALSAYGSSLFMMQSDSIKHYQNALSMIRRSVDAYPSDYIESKHYAFLSSQIRDYDEAIRIYHRIDSLFPEKSEVLISLADMYTHKRDLKSALQCIEKYEVIEGKSSQISLQKILYHLNLHDTVSAINEANSLISHNPVNADYYLLKGDVLSYLHMEDSALLCYLKAEEVNPNSGDAKIALASYYLHHNDSVAYDNKVYEALLCDDFDTADKVSLLTDYLAKLFQDNSSMERGDYLFSVLRDQYPHEPQVIDLAARYSAAKGEWATAAEEISYAIDMDPSNVGYWNQLMSYQIAADMYEEAVDTYHRSVARIGTQNDMVYMLGAVYMLDECYDKAIETYKILLDKIAPGLSVTDTITDKELRNSLSYDDLIELSSVYNIIGDTYYQSADTTSAFIAYENSLFFYSENLLTLNNYAYFLTVTGGDLEKAEEMSAKAIKGDPENPTYLDTYAWVLFKKGDYQNAKMYQESAVEKSADDLSSELLEHLGDILFMCGDPKGALENWVKALELDPTREILQRKVEHKTYFYE